MPDDSHNSQWRSADAWRGNNLRQRIGYLLDSENSRRYASSVVARKALRGSRTLVCVRPTVNNHVSLTTVLGYNVTRKTTYQLWSRVYRRTLPRQARLVHHLQHHYRTKVQAQHLFQHQLNVRVQTSEHEATPRLTQPKTRNPIKMWTMNRYGATSHFPKYLNGCKNSERILWMAESPSMVTHTRVLLMNPLWSRRDE